MQLNPFHRNFSKSFWLSFYNNQGIAKIRFTIARPRKNVLVYCGVNHGDSFNRLFTHYQNCYGFEADPVLFAELQTRYQPYPHIQLFNYAVTDYDGEIQFNVCKSTGMSSLGKLNEQAISENNYGESKTITVPCVNLCKFLQQKSIGEIDDYISDIQGFDLHVLKTMQPYIDAGKIKSIQSEVSTGRKLYDDMPDNSQIGFDKLLGDKYELTSQTQAQAVAGELRSGKFEKIQNDGWDYDCRWELK